MQLNRYRLPVSGKSGGTVGLLATLARLVAEPALARLQGVRIMRDALAALLF